MAEISRNKISDTGVITPVGLGCTAGVLYGLNANVILVNVATNNGTPVDIRAEDDAVNETVEQIVKEINPLAFFVADDSSGGVIHMIVDRSVSPEDMQHRIRLIGRTSDWVRSTNTYATTSVGPNAKDISGTTAQLAVSFVTAV